MLRSKRITDGRSCVLFLCFMRFQRSAIVQEIFEKNMVAGVATPDGDAKNIIQMPRIQSTISTRSGGSEMGNGTKPILKAMLVADHVYRDVSTGKMLVCGIFHQVLIRRPQQAPIAMVDVQGGFAAGSPFAYISVTDADGQHQFSLRYVDLANDEVYFEFQVETTCSDPLETIDLAVPLPPLKMVVGVYALELLWKTNDPMGSFRITVGEAK